MNASTAIPESDFNRLVAASTRSAFPQFWLDLLAFVRITGMSPVDVLTAQCPLNVPQSISEAAERLWTEECPFGLQTSRHGLDSLLCGLRVIARRAGLANWATIGFDSLCAGGQA